jgi:DNA-binding transcriptional LysR family regulator
MNMRQLEHVIALAEHRNFHRAAAAVGLTQPALTQSIGNLETEYGVVLFKRSKREISPTAFGITVTDAAKQMLSQLANLRRELELMKNLQAGRLIIGCDAWIAEGMLSSALGRMLERYPDLRFSVRIGSVETMSKELLVGGIDLYVGAPPESRDKRIKWHDFMLPPLVVVCNARHPLLKLDNPTPSDGLAFPIASPILPKWYFDWLNRHIGPGPDIYSYFLESDDIGLIRRLILNTNTIASLLPFMVADEIASGLMRVVPIKEIDFPIPGIIAYTSRRNLPPAGELLLQEILDHARRLA